ncbi:MAG TPA: YggT family protein [Candidatus Cloacimonadota bacterium]|nr:YggT family protein [Candidatus Cloacimonadota bacterium]
MGTGYIILIMIRLMQIYSYLLLARVILSWFMDPYHQVYRFLWSITEPVLAPIRRILPAMGGWDFSPIVAFLAIDIITRFLISIL